MSVPHGMQQDDFFYIASVFRFGKCSIPEYLKVSRCQRMDFISSSWLTMRRS